MAGNSCASGGEEGWAWDATPSTPREDSTTPEDQGSPYILPASVSAAPASESTLRSLKSNTVIHNNFPWFLDEPDRRFSSPQEISPQEMPPETQGEQDPQPNQRSLRSNTVTPDSFLWSLEEQPQKSKTASSSMPSGSTRASASKRRGRVSALRPRLAQSPPYEARAQSHSSSQGSLKESIDEPSIVPDSSPSNASSTRAQPANSPRIEASSSNGPQPSVSSLFDVVAPDSGTESYVSCHLSDSHGDVSDTESYASCHSTDSQEEVSQEVSQEQHQETDLTPTSSLNDSGDLVTLPVVLQNLRPDTSPRAAAEIISRSVVAGLVAENDYAAPFLEYFDKHPGQPQVSHQEGTIRGQDLREIEGLPHRSRVWHQPPPAEQADSSDGLTELERHRRYADGLLGEHDQSIENFEFREQAQPHGEGLLR